MIFTDEGWSTRHGTAHTVFSTWATRWRLSLAVVSTQFDRAFTLAATEALYTSEEKDVVYLKKRRGFIKLALETGSGLVPVFSFVRAILVCVC